VKSIIKFAIMAIGVALASPEAGAASTNYWVQNVNYALNGFIQVNNQVFPGTIVTKQILGFLSNTTNLNNVLLYQTNLVAVTNSALTNMTVQVTNSPFLPSGSFPTNFVVTNGYVVTVGGQSVTNDIVLTQTTNQPPTYTFTNGLAASGNQSAYLFPQLPATLVTAVLVTNSTDTIFALTGRIAVPVVATNANPVPVSYQVNPDFTKLKGAKLIYVVPIVDVTNNLAGRYKVRYSVGKTNNDVDVDGFFTDSVGSQVGIPRTGFTVPRYSRSELTFDSTFPSTFNFAGSVYSYPRQPGTGLRLTGLDIQSRGLVLSGRSLAGVEILKQRKLSGGGDGELTGQIQVRNFNKAPIALSGTITFSGGRLEIVK
jgi:hypothetical protein